MSCRAIQESITMINTRSALNPQGASGEEGGGCGLCGSGELEKKCLGVQKRGKLWKCTRPLAGIDFPSLFYVKIMVTALIAWLAVVAFPSFWAEAFLWFQISEPWQSKPRGLMAGG
eukprot:831706-Pelagomonas_calceolata.AAC.1